MKREDLKKFLGDAGTDEVLDKIMAENGKDIEAQKAKTTAAEADLTTAKNQLSEANDQIKAFKDMKPEEMQAKVGEWETKYNDLVKAHDAETKQRLFDAALEKGLSGANAKNPATVKPLLDLNGLKYNEADGSIIGLKEQLEKLKADEKNGFLFEAEEGENPTPTIVTGSESSTSGKPLSKLEAAMFKGAGLQPPKE